VVRSKTVLRLSTPRSGRTHGSGCFGFALTRSGLRRTWYAMLATCLTFVRTLNLSFIASITHWMHIMSMSKPSFVNGMPIWQSIHCVAIDRYIIHRLPSAKNAGKSLESLSTLFTSRPEHQVYKAINEFSLAYGDPVYYHSSLIGYILSPASIVLIYKF